MLIFLVLPLDRYPLKFLSDYSCNSKNCFILDYMICEIAAIQDALSFVLYIDGVGTIQ